MGEVLAFPADRSRPGQEQSRRPAADGRVGEDPGEARWAVPVIDAGPPAVESAPPQRRTQRAANVAMATLARHDASEAEVRARLAAKGLDDDEVAAELDRLRSVGLVDDTAFAERLVVSLRERKGLGDQAIRSALRARLVPPTVVDAVLADQVEDEEALHDRLRAVADDRARRLTALPFEVAERRLTAYLLRKGYGGSAVRAAVRDALAPPAR